MAKRVFDKRQTSLLKATNRIAEQLEPDQDELLLSRIETVTRSARAQWYIMLSISAYCFVTVLSVEHADFFVPDRKTILPLLTIEIPTLNFFVLSAFLIAAVSLTYHLALQKVWEVFSSAPLKPRGRPLGDQAHPWIVNDMVLLVLRDQTVSRRPFRGISLITAALLSWVIAPLSLAVLWWESMPARMEWVTLGIFLCWAATVVISVRSFLHFRNAILKSAITLRWPSRTLAAFTLVLFASISWARTEGHITLPNWNDSEEPHYLGTLLIFPEPIRNNVRYDAEKYFFDQQNGLKRFIASRLPFVQDLFFLAPLDLRGLNRVNKPAEWLPIREAERIFFADYCMDRDFDDERCGLLERFAHGSSFDLANRQEEWCKNNLVENVNCFNSLQWTSRAYRSNWSGERARQRSAISSLDLRDADLRWADLSGAFLPNVNLSDARLTFTILANTNLEGALLNDTNFTGAVLWNSQLSYSNGENALFYYSNIQGSDFSYAKMRGYDLYEATIFASSFVFADLLGAKLWRSKITASEFDQAFMVSTRWAEAEISSGTILATNLAYANGLDQAQLDAFIGDEETKLTRSREENVPHLRVGKCWSDNDEFVTIFRPTSTLGLVTLSGYVFPPSWICEGQERQWIEASVEPVDDLKEMLLFGDQRIWMFSRELSQ